MRRTVIVLIAALSAMLLAGPSAPAATPRQSDAAIGGRTSVERAAEDLPLHDVRWARRGEVREGVFFSSGKVVTWKGRRVLLQSARSRTGRWTTIKTDLTTASQGIWYLRFEGRIGRHYRVLIPEANWARATRVYVGKIVAD